ncbi:MAG TPA: alpha/beta fold hydrolase [Micrococcaceae bacterium]|nr:alpha/beta fold hydrolase [Micrococcaceae bacterium]
MECRRPKHGCASRGVAVLVHGGYWRARHNLTLMNPLAESLTAAGWAVANIEYRRVGDGGSWPAIIEDLRAALDSLAASAWRSGHPGPVIGVGHSAGGQLALLAAERLDAVAALAPVTDCARTDREGLGENAALEFFGSHATDLPDAYAEASPIHALPLGVPVLILHGAVDIRVPLEHSLAYAEAARHAGDEVDLRIIPGLDHLSCIDPENPAWAEVQSWLDGLAVHRSALSSPSA